MGPPAGAARATGARRRPSVPARILIVDDEAQVRGFVELARRLRQDDPDLKVL